MYRAFELLFTVHWTCYYCAVRPPSTVIEHPVTNEAASEHSQMTASAISSGRALRPIGSTSSSRAASLGRPATIPWTSGVSTTPGHTSLTLIPERAYSSAAHFVRPTTPCLAAVYAGIECDATNPAAEAVLTIAPDPFCARN